LAKFKYICTDCGKSYNQDEVKYLCPSCSPETIPQVPLKGVLQCSFNYSDIAKKSSLEGFNIDLFSPVDPVFYPKTKVGNTPFIQLNNLQNQLKLDNLWLKNDSLNLSGSLKDRASFLVVAEANRLGLNTIITASTGNAACALAAICAADNKKAVIFVPKTAPKAKLTQLKLYGADLKIVDGTYDDAYRESLIYSQKNAGLNRNTAYHPFTIEGKKTVALEIFAQNNYKAPDYIFVPVGDGVIISGVYKGFYDLKMAGFIDKMPVLVSVQAEKSSAINNYFNTGVYKPSLNPDTLADSISVTNPGNASMAVKALKDTNGLAVNVSDLEIMQAQTLLASSSGIYAEPAASASLAGLIKIKSQIPANKQIVLLITGNGLKDIDASINFLDKGTI
jgi:threonine synthase